MTSPSASPTRRRICWPRGGARRGRRGGWCRGGRGHPAHIQARRTASPAWSCRAHGARRPTRAHRCTGTAGGRARCDLVTSQAEPGSASERNSSAWASSASGCDPSTASIPSRRRHERRPPGRAHRPASIGRPRDPPSPGAPQRVRRQAHRCSPARLHTARGGAGGTAAGRGAGGDGPSFCAGADVTWMRAKPGSVARAERAGRDGHGADVRCHRPLSRPGRRASTVPPWAGGMGLCAVADLVIAEAGTRFGFTETRL